MVKSLSSKSTGNLYHPSIHHPSTCWTRLGWKIDSPRCKVVLGAKVFDNLVQWLLLVHVHDAEQLLVWFPFDRTHLACRFVQVLRFLRFFRLQRERCDLVRLPRTKFAKGGLVARRSLHCVIWMWHCSAHLVFPNGLQATARAREPVCVSVQVSRTAKRNDSESFPVQKETLQKEWTMPDLNRRPFTWRIYGASRWEA